MVEHLLQEEELILETISKDSIQEGNLTYKINNNISVGNNFTWSINTNIAVILYLTTLFSTSGLLPNKSQRLQVIMIIFNFIWLIPGATLDLLRSKR